jgi:hypothetical protein
MEQLVAILYLPALLWLGDLEELAEVPASRPREPPPHPRRDPGERKTRGQADNEDTQVGARMSRPKRASAEAGFLMLPIIDKMFKSVFN